MASQKKQFKKQQKANEQRQEIENAKIREKYTREGRAVPYNALPKASFSKSTSPAPFSLKTTTPGQENALEQLASRFPQAINNLALPGDRSTFGPIANEAMRNHTQQSIPTLAQRFAGLDAMGSSGFQQALSGSQGDFESQLASLYAQHGLTEQNQQSSNLHNILNSYLQPQFASGVNPGQDSSLRQGWNGVKNLASKAVDIYTGGLSNGLTNGWGNNQSNNGQRSQAALPQFQPQAQTNGTGVGTHSYGFSAPQANPLSMQSIASSAGPNLSGLQTGNNQMSPYGNPQGYNNMILQGYNNKLFR